MKHRGAVILLSALFNALFCAALHSQAPATRYPAMAPLDQYLMDRDAEIALAQSAAPASISKDAEILFLTRHGYETAIKGKNGFTCLIQRSWTAGITDPDFWNPKLRAPICLNPPAVRSNLPIVIKKTQLVLAGATKDQMFAGLQAAFEKNKLSSPEPGSMCYMMSPRQYLSDTVVHWHPHLMFFLPLAEDPAAWAANLPGSPVLGTKSAEDHMTLFLIPLSKWSDGSPGPPLDDFNK